MTRHNQVWPWGPGQLGHGGKLSGAPGPNYWRSERDIFIFCDWIKTLLKNKWPLILESKHTWRVASNVKVIFVVIGETGKLIWRKILKQLRCTFSICHNLQGKSPYLMLIDAVQEHIGWHKDIPTSDIQINRYTDKQKKTDLSPPAFCSVLVKLGTGRTLWPDHSTQAQRAAPLRECPPPVWTREGRCRVRSWRRRVASGRTASSLTSPSPASSTSWIPPPCWSETSQTQETGEGCRLELLSQIFKKSNKRWMPKSGPVLDLYFQSI